MHLQSVASRFHEDALQRHVGDVACTFYYGVAEIMHAFCPMKVDCNTM